MTKILKQVLAYLFGDVTAKVIPFLIIPYLTNKLGVDGYGELSYFLAIMLFVSSLFNLGQDVTYTKSKFSHGDAISFFMFSFGLYLSTVLLILSLPVLFVSNVDSIYILITLTAYSLYTLNKMYSYSQVNFFVKKYIFIQLLAGVFSSVVTVVVYEYCSISIEGRLLVLLSTNILSTGLFVYWYRGRILRKCIKKRRVLVRYFFYSSIPMLFHGSVLAAKVTMDKVILSQKYEMDLLGIYSLGYQVAAIYGLVLVSLNKGFMPHFFKLLNKKTINCRGVVYVSLMSLGIAPISYIAALLIPNELYIWIFGDGFDGIKQLVAIFVAAFSIQIPYFILGNYLIFKGDNIMLASSTAITTLIYLALLYLIDNVNINIAAVMFLVSGLLQVFYLMFNLLYKNRGKNE